MLDAREKGLSKFDDLQDEKLQISLMKVVAEQNQEKFLEYDCATDVAVLAVVSNGRFIAKEVMMDYLSKRDQLFARIAEEDHALYRQEFEKCLKKPLSRVFDIRFLDNKGEMNWHRVFLVSIADESRKVVKVAARMLSIHKEKLATELLRIQAERDSLTGVYNHSTYEELCKDIIRKNSDGVLYLMVDIDNFKQVNDAQGHHAGDSIIMQVGNVLSVVVKNQGIAGRIGGDEFSVCLTNIWDKETAINICSRIKEALKTTTEGVDFTVSIGVARSGGRICTFEELFFEAEEALYFAKENGKNQVVFSEEISQRKQELLLERKSESSLTEEEIELDEMIEYRLIVDPTSKKILYINRSARNALGVSLEEAQKMCCYDFLLGRCKECNVCELYSNHVEVLKTEETIGLKKYIPQGYFLVQSKYATWKGEPARIIEFMDMNDAKHLEQCVEQEMESQETISRCWNIINETNTQDVDYTKVLRVVNEYYDADCSVIISKNGSEYKDIFEYHRPSAEAVVEGIYQSVKEGVFPKMEVLIDEKGFMRRRHIEKKLMENLDLIEELERRFVHNTIGIKLARREEFVGILLVINPRHHVDEYNILKRIGIFFTTDLLRKTLSDTISYEESHDILTKLWNRAYFREWQAKFGGAFTKDFGIFTADIFHLGEINQEFGYENGNERLLEVANLFKKVFGGYSVFRYDTDQIMAICHNTNKEDFQKLVNYFKELAEELNVELSIGYSWAADSTLPEVLREAKDFLEKDRERLENSNDRDGKTLKQIEQDIGVQTRNGNFRVFLQPKVQVATEKTIGAEALIRLYDDARGYVSPAYFIPLLEERGVVYLIDLFVLEEVFKFQKEAYDARKEVVPISVNFSKNTLMYKDLLSRIREMVDAYPIPEGLVQMEITETISSMDHIMVHNIANALRHMGFSVSMDDFGTKYSNMAVLTQFEFDTVKVDRSLLLDVEKNYKNKTVLKHTLEMLKEIGVETVMEGVETIEQVAILRELGCDTIQGYYYGRPEPMSEFYERYM